MSAVVKTGRKPAVSDRRVPFLHQLPSFVALPPPPDESNYYAGPEADTGWRMLGNDTLGDCVPAAVAHGTQIITDYAGTRLVPTREETIVAYQTQGYVPGQPATDQGSLMMGPAGIMQELLTRGFVFGGKRVKIDGFVQLRTGDFAVANEWRKALHYFNFLLLGINLPQIIVAGDTIPYMWPACTGPNAGGHEIVAAGCQVLYGVLYFDVVTWGMRCRVSAADLALITEEAQAVYMPDALNKIGVNADGFDHTQLLQAMAALGA